MGPESEPGEEQARSPHDGKGHDVFAGLKGGQCEQSVEDRGEMPSEAEAGTVVRKAPCSGAPLALKGRKVTELKQPRHPNKTQVCSVIRSGTNGVPRNCKTLKTRCLKPSLFTEP